MLPDESRSSPSERVGCSSACTHWAYLSTSLVFIAPLLVTLALRVIPLVGIEQAPKSLGLIAGLGSLLAGSVGTLLVALAANVAIILLGWCIAQISSAPCSQPA